MIHNRKPIFDVVREMLGRGFRPSEVEDLDEAIDEAEGLAARKRTMTDPAGFFAGVRAITGPLDQTQVDTLNRLVDAAPHWPASWLAYALATAWHEARLMPIAEKGGPGYLARYEGRKDLGNVQKGDGVKYAGRGLVQLTGRRNYTLAGDELGLNLLNDPDLALNPAHATRILVWGMEGGRFTGKGLGDYLPKPLGLRDEFIAARRIINGTDRAAKIADYAIGFQSAVAAGGWS